MNLGEKDLGSSSNVIVRITRNIPSHTNHKVFFYNYFTSLPLMIYFKKKGIYALGTVKVNRIPNCKLPKAEEFKKKYGRDTFIEYYTIIRNCRISNKT